MAAAAIKDSSNQGFAISLGLHVIVILLAWKGLPFLTSLPPPPPDTLIVDLVPIEDITAAAPRATPEPPPDPVPLAPPEPPKPVQAEAPAADAMPSPPAKEQIPDKVAEKPPEPMVKPIPKPAPPKNKKDD